MKSDLDALVEELEAGTWRYPKTPVNGEKASGCDPRESCASSCGDACSPLSLGAERRFGQPHARLFPSLGRKVRTPNGPGTLLQVFADRVMVLLDSELSKCSFFRPGEIEPVSKAM